MDSTVSGLIYLAISAAIYFLPTIVAKNRGAENAAPTFIVNLFLGWTLIGWVVALAMGAGAKKRVVGSAQPQPSNPVQQTASHLATAATQTGNFASAELERLGGLRARGMLTDEEFTAAKGTLLGLPSMAAAKPIASWGTPD